MKSRYTKKYFDETIEFWRFRWSVTRGGKWNRLHRVVSGKIRDEDFVGVTKGKTLCGLEGEFQMPGICSRMGLIRCAHCCRKAGIPIGPGNPYNSLKGKAQNA